MAIVQLFDKRLGMVTDGKNVIQFDDRNLTKIKAAWRNMKTILPLPDKPFHVAENRVDWLVAGVNEEKQKRFFAEIRPYLWVSAQLYDSGNVIDLRRRWSLQTAMRLLNSGKITEPKIEQELIHVLICTPDKLSEIAKAALSELLKNGEIKNKDNVVYATEQLDDRRLLFGVLAKCEMAWSDQIVGKLAGNLEELVELINSPPGNKPVDLGNTSISLGMLRAALANAIEKDGGALLTNVEIVKRGQKAAEITRAFVNLRAVPDADHGVYRALVDHEHGFVRFLEFCRGQKLPSYGTGPLNELTGARQLAAAKILFPQEPIERSYVYADIISSQELRLDEWTQAHMAELLVKAAENEGLMSRVRKIAKGALAKAEINGVKLGSEARIILETAGLDTVSELARAVSGIIKGINRPDRMLRNDGTHLDNMIPAVSNSLGALAKALDGIGGSLQDTSNKP